MRIVDRAVIVIASYQYFTVFAEITTSFSILIFLIFSQSLKCRRTWPIATENAEVTVYKRIYKNFIAKIVHWRH